MVAKGTDIFLGEDNKLCCKREPGLSLGLAPNGEYAPMGALNAELERVLE